MAAGRSADSLRFACDCGTVIGHLSPRAVQTGTRLVCFCRDCRAASIHLGRPDPAPNPVDVFQTSPEGVRFDAGQEALGVFRLGPRGLMRWYATCCGTPMFNTLPNPGIPFVSVLSDVMDSPDALGKFRGKGFMPAANGTYTHEGAAAMVWGLATRILASRLSGSWKATPFHDIDTGQPVVVPTVLSKDQRAALTS